MKISIARPIIASLVALVITNQPITARPNLETMIDSRELYEVEATAYCNPNGNLTCTGRKTTEGLTIATCKEWLGCTIYVWLPNEDGEYEFYAILEAMDTGGDYRIKNGECIDIFIENHDEAIKFGRKKARIQIVRGVG